MHPNLIHLKSLPSLTLDGHHAIALNLDGIDFLMVFIKMFGISQQQGS